MTPSSSKVVELVVTCGDPQGIGPEVAVKAARIVGAENAALRVVLVGPADVWREAGADGGWPRVVSDASDAAAPAGVSILSLPDLGVGDAAPPSSHGGAAAIAALDVALRRVEADRSRALVTAPLSKAAVRLAGFAGFDGHTGYVAKFFGVERPVMLFDAPGFRVALATVHAALRDVPHLLTRARLVETIRVIDADLRGRFGIAEPRIDVLGLNPHAGEGGAFGDEEIRTIGPALDDLRALGLRVSGPLAADAYFIKGFEARADCVVAMYHDQGLVAVKSLAFTEAVNVTLGLPIVRTSPDHGTAYALKGRDLADPAPMAAALRAAARLCG